MRMSSVVELYEALSTAPDDRTRARVIAEAFERLEDRYPHLPELVTQSHVRESELRLQKEIAQVYRRISNWRSNSSVPNSSSISSVCAVMSRASRSIC
jgi:hypothetical protein